MPSSQRSASQVHAALIAALEQLRRAEKCAVMQFSEIWQRRLFRQLGHASIESYAREALGFSENKTRQFMRLAESFDRLPELKHALKQNTISWTKARSVARVASESTEKQWIAVAASSSSRVLEEKIRTARKQSGESRPQLFERHDEPRLPAPNSQITFSLSPELKSKFDACVESLRKRGDRRSRDLLLVEAFALLASDASVPRGTENPPYQIVIYRCESCGEGRLPDGSAIDEAAVQSAACDCRQHDGEKPNRASIPPARRRQVLARDGYRCRVAGCGSTRFLEVHHIAPRERGGDNSPGNLISLCGSCHRLAHERPQFLASGAGCAEPG